MAEMHPAAIVAFAVLGVLVVAVLSATSYIAFKNCTAQFVPPRTSPVPQGRIRICVAGFTHSPPTAKAHFLADMIAKRFPAHYETWYYFDQWTFYDFTKWKFESVPFPDHLKGHNTSPFCWVVDSTGAITPIGGAEHFSEWVLHNIDDSECHEFAEVPWGFGTCCDGSARAHHMKAPATAV